jgi:hypothetical protein
VRGITDPGTAAISSAKASNVLSEVWRREPTDRQVLPAVRYIASSGTTSATTTEGGGILSEVWQREPAHQQVLPAVRRITGYGSTTSGREASNHEGEGKSSSPAVEYGEYCHRYKPSCSRRFCFCLFRHGPWCRTNTHTNAYAYAHANTYAHTDAFAYTCTDTYPNAHANTNAYPNADAKW